MWAIEVKSDGRKGIVVEKQTVPASCIPAPLFTQHLLFAEDSMASSDVSQNPPEQLPPSTPVAPLWMAVASVAILLHFAAVGSLVLAAPSGPWPVPEGKSWATPPQFAQSTVDMTLPYLKAVKFTDFYHYPENFMDSGSVNGSDYRILATLKDEKGDVIKELVIPDPNANPAVRFREKLIAMALASDERVEPLPGEYIPAPNQKVRKVKVWRMKSGANTANIEELEEHLVPRDEPVFGPSEMGLALARSYGRYLTRTYGAASVEIVRESKDVIPPDMLFMDANDLPPAEAFNSIKMNFGEFHAPRDAQ